MRVNRLDIDEGSSGMNVRSGLVIGGAVLVLVGLMSSPPLSFGSDQVRVKEMIQQTCTQCHRTWSCGSGMKP
jgi:hypothetical protein